MWKAYQTVALKAASTAVQLDDVKVGRKVENKAESKAGKRAVEWAVHWVAWKVF